MGRRWLNRVSGLVALLSLIACEKEIPGSQKSTVDEDGNLTVQVYQIAEYPFSAITRVVGADLCNRLNYAVYDMDGMRVKQVNQQSSDSGFGTASFTLEEGNYQVVVVGHSSNGNPTMTNLEKIQFTNAQGFSDTFLHYGTVEVEKEEKKLEVGLQRIVSMCRFVIKDAIPEGVAQMRFYYTGGSGAFSALTGLGCVNSKQQMTYSVQAGATNTNYDLYTILHQEEDAIDLVVTAYDASGNILYERKFEVPMKRNRITMVSGDFFEGGSSSSQGMTITIAINGVWDSEWNMTY